MTQAEEQATVAVSEKQAKAAIHYPLECKADILQRNGVEVIQIQELSGSE